jgi:hypothetical protein
VHTLGVLLNLSVICMGKKEAKEEKGGEPDLSLRKIVQVHSFESGSCPVVSPEGESFLGLIGKRVLYHYASGHMFFYIRNGIIHTIDDKGGLDFAQLCSLMERGLDHFNVKDANPVYEPEWASHSAVKECWGEARKRVETARGSPTGTPMWLVKSDFGDAGDLMLCREYGFFLNGHMVAAMKKGFPDGPSYYFARHMKLIDHPHRARVASEHNITDVVFLNFFIKGDFEDTPTANEAKENGFKNLATMILAREAGCATMAQYNAISQHGWGDLKEFQSAEGLGFQETEHDLFVYVYKAAHMKHMQTLLTNGFPDAIDLIRKHRKLSLIQEDEGLKHLWQAFVVNMVKKSKKDMIGLDDMISGAIAFAGTIDITLQEHHVRSFIYESDRMHILGEARIPRGIFSRKRNLTTRRA